MHAKTLKIMFYYSVFLTVQSESDVWKLAVFSTFLKLETNLHRSLASEAN